MRNKKGITLISLIVTIVVLLILASVSIAILTGENGILTKTSDAKKQTELKNADEAMKIVVTGWKIEKSIGKMAIEEFLTNKVPNEIDGYDKIGDNAYELQKDGYVLVIDADGNIIEETRKAGVKPKANVKMITTEYVFEGTNVEFEIEVILPKELTGATVTIEKPEAVTKTGTNVYSVNKNGKYNFEIKANKDGKDYNTIVVATIDKILEKPTANVTDETSGGFTINVTNVYSSDISLKYEYYVGSSAISGKISKKTYKVEGLSAGTSYSAKVRVYINETNYMESNIITAETKGTEIRTVADLRNIANNMSGKYQLMNNIDLTGITWSPIGNTADTYFTGTLDGNGYIIKNLTVTEAGGLFLKLKDAKIKNLGIENSNITFAQSAPIARRAEGQTEINKVYTTGVVTEHRGAGIISYISAGGVKILNSYSTVSIGGAGGGGGIVSQGTASHNVENCYFNGSVAYKSTYKGGGITNNEKTIATNCYYNKEKTTTSITIAGVTGCTTTQMRTQSNYNNWDFDNIWYMDTESGYPKLRVFNK